MNNVFVYCEVEGTTVAEVSQELLTKGRKLANQQGVELHAIVAGTGIKGKVEDQILPYGVDKLFVFDAEGLFPYTSAPHTDILVNLFKEENPQIALMGATVIGRDLGPRVSSSLTSGLTADCTELEIGEYDDKKSGKHYDGLLYQIRPAFGGNIVATIVNPEHRPQMACSSLFSSACCIRMSIRRHGFASTCKSLLPCFPKLDTILTCMSIFTLYILPILKTFRSFASERASARC